MQATFPVVLPNVWLPSEPIIDVMDGGLRDNYGVDNSLRFLTAMQDWIAENTSGVWWCRSATAWMAAGTVPLNREHYRQCDQAVFAAAEQLVQNDGVFPKRYVLLFHGQCAVPGAQRGVSIRAVERRKQSSFELSSVATRKKRDIAASIYSPQNRESFKKMESITAARTTDKLAGNSLSVTAH
jgi:hypothetical protein